MYVGIDPGYSGAIALLDEQKELVSVVPMPVKQRGRTKWVSAHGMFDILKGWQRSWGLEHAFVERIFTNKLLNWGFGVVRSSVLDVGIGLTLVDPKGWQHYAFGKLNGKNKGLSEAWCVSRYDAEQLMLDGAISPDFCDAIIIACTGIDAKKAGVTASTITARTLGY